MSAERDKAVETLLRAQKTRATGAACLEPEVLAAWVDGGLTDQEIAQVEAHVADCSRCQALVATLAREPQTVPAADPWWKRGWRIGILVPLTAGAMAVALWVASPAYRSPAPPPQAAAQARVEPSPKLQEAPSSDRFQAPQPQANEERRAESAAAPEAFRDRYRAKQDAVGGRTAEAVPEKRESLDKLARVDEQKKTSAEADGRFAEARNQAAPLTAPPAAPVPPPPSALPATPVPAPPQGVAPTTPSASADAAGKTLAAPRDTRATGASAPPPTAQSSVRAAAPARELRFAQKAAPLEIASPNPSIRWRIGPAGSIEYSTTSGASWRPLVSGVSSDLTAGSSPAPSVCWIVGRAGTVLLTTDGTRWQRIAFPETVDLTAIQATDARTATVTAANGRAFRTTDGGTTWSSLQDF